MTNSNFQEIKMKRFILSVLFATVFFMGLGVIFEKTHANFKSDERALTLIRQAREAIGGDANINNVRSMTIIAKATKTFEMDGAANTEQGDFELNLQLPNQLSKSLQIKRGDGSTNGETSEFIEKNVDVVVINKGENAEAVISDAPNGDKKKVGVKAGGEPLVLTPEGEAGKNKVVIVKKGGDGENATWTTEDGKKVIVNKDVRVVNNEGGFPRQNELFRVTLSLLLSAPEGLDVSYTYAGDGSVDGNSCDIVEAQTGGASYKLYLDKSSHLPRMIAFQGAKPMIFKFKKAEGAPTAEDKEVRVFTHKMDTPEMAEYQVKFTDYRNTGGVRLPYRWEQTIGGKADEILDVTSYEINPANITDKFKKEGHKVMIRTKKPE